MRVCYVKNHIRPQQCNFWPNHSLYCFYHHQFLLVSIIPTVNMGNRRMKKLHYFPAAIHECCGSTEMCARNSQEPGGHCSHCTFQILSEKSRGKSACLHMSSLKWEKAGNVCQSFTRTYCSLDTSLQLGSFSWENPACCWAFCPGIPFLFHYQWDFQCRQGISASKRLAGPMAQDFWAQGRQQESAWTAFSLTELHTSDERYINYVLFCKRERWVTYKKQPQSLSRNIHSRVLF